MSKFRPGQSGNPRGRPKGTAKAAKLMRAIEEDLPAIITSMAEAAKDGDVQAARLLLDRAVPALKPVERPATFPHAVTLGDTGEAILATAAAGKLTPGQASQLISGVVGLSRVRESDELVKRLEQLEEKIHAITESTN